MSYSKQHVIERADGRTRKLLGYKYREAPEGTKDFEPGRLDDASLPAKVDLRAYMTPIENQGNLNSCVANAVAGAYEYLAKRHLGDDSYDVSRLYVYYNARRRSGAENEDEGSLIGDATGLTPEHVSRMLRSLREQGIVSLLHRRLVVQDAARLVALADPPKGLLGLWSDPAT